MPRYSLKQILIGLTLFSVGFGMLAGGFRGIVQPASEEMKWLRALLIAGGGAAVGYGVATPVKFPPHKMVLGMAGMFAAQSWDSGSYFGLLVYAGLAVVVGTFNEWQRRWTKPTE